MANIKSGNERTFNEVVETYDKMRPTYVDELYKDIFDFIKINQDSQVLEVGIGTGQATGPILNTGCSITAIELGDKLAAYVERKFKEYPNFHVENVSFQDYEGQREIFDLIYSATAFHWIPEEIGYSKVYELLKRGGVFARFANHPYKDKGKEELNVEIQKLYSVYMPHGKPSSEYTQEKAYNIAEIARKYGFSDITYKLYKRTRIFTAEEYIALLGTYSDHIALESNMRKEFYDKVKQVINDFGGTITIYDTIDLELARKVC